MVDVKPEDIESLVTAFDNSTWDELRVRLGTLEIHLSKNPDDRHHPNGSTVEVTNVAVEQPSLPSPGPISSDATAFALGPGTTPARREIPGTAAKVHEQAGAFPESMVVVKAPNFGTFYRAPKPGAAPYVEVGQRVDPETEICLIEVMKLFTPVQAGLAGTIRDVLVTDAAMVEFDQPLFLIEPG